MKISWNISYKKEQVINKSKNEKYLGYGQAQNKLALPLYILLFTQGSQSIVISLLLPQLEEEWNISILEKSILISAIFFGVGLGTFLQSYSDQYGRQLFIRKNAIFQTLFGILSCFAPNMVCFIFLRFFYGIGIGVAFPLSRKYISQITPHQGRLLLLTRLRTYFAIGCLFTYVVAWKLLQSNQWRLLLFIICLPGIYALYQIRQNGKQSLKYLWYNNKHQQAFQLISYMTKLNNKQQIPKEQIEYLVNLQKVDIQNIQYKDLFDPKYKNLTIVLMFTWFSTFFIYYGIFLFLPTILRLNNQILRDYEYLTLCSIVGVQILCSALSQSIMEHELFGRKRTLFFSLFMVTMFSLSLMVAQYNDLLNFIISFIGIKMFITFAFMVHKQTIFPYTVQIQSALMRRRSKGIFLAAGRVGTILLGLIGLYSLNCLNGDGLYLIFGFLSLISGYLIVKLPFDNLNRLSDISFFFS